MLEELRRGGADVLVAHNIAFDLHYLIGDSGVEGQECDERTVIIDWLYDNAIWDTMLAEYLLSGQRSNTSRQGALSLDTVATTYGGTVKDSRMKEYWDAGVCTTEIPKEEILPYLKDDVKNLRIIYEAQMEEAKRLGMLPLIQSQMRARLTTLLMEFNGMHFDLKECHSQTVDLTKKEAFYAESCKRVMGEAVGKAWISQLTPNSAVQIEAILFGGILKLDSKEVVLGDDGEPVVYKSGAKKGQQKTRKTKVEVPVEGRYDPLLAEVPQTAGGKWSTGTEVISNLAASHPEDSFLGELQKYRDVKKQVSTYFKGYSQLVWPTDSLIHGKINHCRTKTGRLSSSSPNLQNISNKEVKTGV
jgi:DNA polymerase I-like protein with 3'-5' exonuclease and polymerase domains